MLSGLLAFISNSLTFLSGILASFIAWLLVSNIIKPRIRLSDTITRNPNETTAFIYRITVENLDFFRKSVYDVNLEGRLFIKSMGRVFRVRVGLGYVPYIASSKKDPANIRSFHVTFAEKTREKGGRLWRLYHELHPESDLKAITIEDALNMCPGNVLEISATCSHEFSGARCVTSRLYTSDDIVPCDTPRPSNDD